MINNEFIVEDNFIRELFVSRVTLHVAVSR
jgi:hypothetical protein